MSFPKKPFRKLKELIGTSNNNSSNSVPSKVEGTSGSSTPINSQNGSGTPNGNGNGNGNDSKRQSLGVDRKRQSIDKARTKAENKKRQSMARIKDERFLKEGPPALTKLYKPYSMNMSKRWDQEKRILFKELDFKRGFANFEIAE
jgi:ergosteryl-3beta-O-L-aspartate synthase